MSPEELALGVVTLITGVINMPITGYFKKKWNLDDTSALGLATAMSVVVSVVALVAAGTIGYVDFAWENLPATVTVVYGLSVVVYNGMRGKKPA